MTPLREWRKAQNISMAEVARRLETSIATVSRIERGEQWPSRDMLAAIAETTGGKVTPNDFVLTPTREGSEAAQ